MSPDAVLQAALWGLLAPVRSWLEDSRTVGLLVSAPDEVYVESRDGTRRVEAAFADGEALWAIVRGALQGQGRRLEETDAAVSVVLPDGLELDVVLPPASGELPIISLRWGVRSGGDRSMPDLGEFFPGDAAAKLRSAVAAAENVLVCGPRRSGTTSLLSLLARQVPAGERLVVLERLPELGIERPQLIRLRFGAFGGPGSRDGAAAALLAAAVRLRPGRLVVGDTCAELAGTLVRLAASGRIAWLGAMHAGSPEQALRQLELAQHRETVGLPRALARAEAASAVDWLVSMRAVRGGPLRVDRLVHVVRTWSSSRAARLLDVLPGPQTLPFARARGGGR